MTSTHHRHRTDDASDPANWKRYGRALLVAVGLSLVALVVSSLLSLGSLLFASGTAVVAILSIYVLIQLGYLVTGWLYLRRWVADSTIRIERPDRHQLGWTVVSTLFLGGIAMGLGYVSTQAGIEIGRADQGLFLTNRTVVIGMAVLSLVLIAPVEEFFFRGVIQRRLTRTFSTPIAIGVTSLLFVLPHAIGYLGNLQSILFLSLAPFAMAVVVGALYEKFDNFLLPVLCHGVYNATLFLSTLFMGV